MEPFLYQSSASLATALCQISAFLTDATGCSFSFCSSSAISSLNPELDRIDSRSSSSRTLPPETGVINVVDYGAIPNDGKDDTDAIRKALDENDGELRRVLYFPNGVYDIIDPLQTGAQAALTVGDNQRTSFWGESRDGVVLRLADNHSDFQDQTRPKAIFRMSPSLGFSFHSSVQNMTFDVGSENPGAIGIQYFSNNGGTLGNVKIVSQESPDESRAGFVGLDLYVDNNGPTFIKDVEIIGFDTGIRDEWGLWGHTMESIDLKHQNKVGYEKNAQTVSIRNLTSVNDVPVFEITNASGALTLVDTNLKTASASSSNPAIQFNSGSLFVRNLDTTGYASAIQYRDGSTLVAEPDVETYSAIATPTIPLQQNPAAGNSALTLNLTVPPVPDVPWETDFDNWAGPQQFGGVAGDGIDDTAALQAAIDSGATTVYLPGTQTWDINGDVYLRGNVQRLTAFSRLDGNGRFIVVDQNAEGKIADPLTLPQTVIIEHMWAFRGIEHQSDRTLVVSDIEGGDITAGEIGKGDLFIQDVVGNLKLGQGRRAWAWQLNTEYGESPLNPELDSEDIGIINDGGQLWILGMKTEKGSVKIDTKNGGTTEVLGAHIAEVGNDPQTDEPIFRSIDSNVSYVNLRTSSFSDNQYKTLISETRRGETWITPRTAGFNANEVWATGGGVVLPVYVGRRISSPQ